MTLAMLRVGEKGRILRVSAEGALKRRLLDMGVIAGETVAVQKIAPLGDPMEILVKAYHLSLRKKEAEGITVEKL